MKLDEAIRQAADKRDPLERARAVRGVADFMRFSLGWSYAKCARAAEASGVTAGRWEELLREADDNP